MEEGLTLCPQGFSITYRALSAQFVHLRVRANWILKKIINAFTNFFPIEKIDILYYSLIVKVPIVKTFFFFRASIKNVFIEILKNDYTKVFL